MRLPASARNPQLMVLCLVVFAAYTGQGMITTVRVLYVHSHGGTLTVISAMTAAFLIANFIFQYPWGWLADRWGRKPVIVVGLVGQAIFTAAYLSINDPALFVAIRFLEGAAAASVLPAARAAIADLVPDDQRGRAYGIFSAFFNLGFLFGPAAGGLLAAISYNLVFGIAVALRLVAVVIIWQGLHTVEGHDQSPSGETRLSMRSLFTRPLIAGYIIAFGDYVWIGFDLTLAPLWMREHLGASVALIGVTYSIWPLPSAILAPLAAVWPTAIGDPSSSWPVVWLRSRSTSSTRRLDRYTRSWFSLPFRLACMRSFPRPSMPTSRSHLRCRCGVECRASIAPSASRGPSRGPACLCLCMRSTSAFRSWSWGRPMDSSFSPEAS